MVMMKRKPRLTCSFRLAFAVFLYIDFKRILEIQWPTFQALRNKGVPMIYQADTNGFSVFAEPTYHGSELAKESRYHIFGYKITISNHSDRPAQLLSRRWIIRDGSGREEQVKGDGVIGQKPWINPGESYSYMSGCPLPSATGNMRGSYRLATEDGGQFDIKIPLFFLRHDDCQNIMEVLN